MKKKKKKKKKKKTKKSKRDRSESPASKRARIAEEKKEEKEKEKKLKALSALCDSINSKLSPVKANLAAMQSESRFDQLPPLIKAPFEACLSKVAAVLAQVEEATASGSDKHLTISKPADCQSLINESKKVQVCSPGTKTLIFIPHHVIASPKRVRIC